MKRKLFAAYFKKCRFSIDVTSLEEVEPSVVAKTEPLKTKQEREKEEKEKKRSGKDEESDPESESASPTKKSKSTPRTASSTSLRPATRTRASERSKQAKANNRVDVAGIMARGPTMPEERAPVFPKDSLNGFIVPDDVPSNEL
jgi:hypothetical protein